MKCPHCNRYHVLTRTEMKELAETKKVKVICNECIEDFIIFFDDEDKMHVEKPKKEMTEAEYKVFSLEGFNDKSHVDYLIKLRDNEIARLLHNPDGSKELLSTLNFALRTVKYTYENLCSLESKNMTRLYPVTNINDMVEFETAYANVKMCQEILRRIDN